MTETDAGGGGPFKALLVTGKTYPVRRELRAFGGHFSRDEGGHLCPPHKAEAVRAFAAEHGFTVTELEFDADPFAPLTPEQLREHRNARRARKADRLDAQAANREKDAAAARARHRPYTSDYSFITQPILVGHHSQRRHERLWDRIDAARDAEMRNSIEADKLRATAQHLRTGDAAVKGDAAARYEARRKAAEATGMRVGSWIHCHVYGEGRITRENAKTYTVAFVRGHTQNIDKGWATLLRHDDTPLPEPAFKKGDRVLASRFGGHKPRPATVQRRTTRGFSVLIDGEQEPVTLNASSLSSMPAENAA